MKLKLKPLKSDVICVTANVAAGARRRFRKCKVLEVVCVRAAQLQPDIRKITCLSTRPGGQSPKVSSELRTLFLGIKERPELHIHNSTLY